MRGFLGRAGALLGRVLVSFGLGSSGDAEPPEVDTSQGCHELSGRPVALQRHSGGIVAEHVHSGNVVAAHRLKGRIVAEHVLTFEGC